MEPADRSLFPGALEMIILQTLRRAPLHGYALAQIIKGNSGDLLQVGRKGRSIPRSNGCSKPAGLPLTGAFSPRNRKVLIYKITPTGRKQLERSVSSFQQMLEGIARAMRAVQS